MRFLFAIPLVLFSFGLSAQYNTETWETTKIVDEFGDETGEVAKSIFCEGTFSNSATSGSDLYARVIDQENILAIQLFEYQTPPSVSLAFENAVGQIKVKRADKSVETYKAFASKDGGVYFTADVGRDFYSLVVNGGGEEITVLIKQEDFTEYGRAQYRFKLKTQPAE